MRRKLKLATVLCTFALVVGGTGTAFAGEVRGAPGTPGVPFSGSGIRTGAPAHANSICAYSGLNDMNPSQGPIGSITQTPANQGSPGDPGHGACAGGTNPENPPAP